MALTSQYRDVGPVRGDPSPATMGASGRCSWGDGEHQMHGFDLTKHSDHGPSRLAMAVRARRAALGMTIRDVEAAGGPSHQTMFLIEQAARPSYAWRTITSLTKALNWPPDGVDHIVRGLGPGFNAADGQSPISCGGVTSAEREADQEALRQMMMTIGRRYGVSTIMTLTARVVTDLSPSNGKRPGRTPGR